MAGMTEQMPDAPVPLPDTIDEFIYLSPAHLLSFRLSVAMKTNSPP